jgi:hypothetical protein
MVHLLTSIGSLGGPSSGVVEVAASNSAETVKSLRYFLKDQFTQNLLGTVFLVCLLGEGWKSLGDVGTCCAGLGGVFDGGGTSDDGQRLFWPPALLELLVLLFSSFTAETRSI